VVDMRDDGNVPNCRVRCVFVGQDISLFALLRGGELIPPFFLKRATIQYCHFLS